jgi:protein-tyrosine-phosphatase
LALQKTVSPTVETLGLLFGIDASDHRPRSFASVDARDIEIIVAIDDPGRIDVKQYLIQSGVPPSKITAWEVRDPFGGDASKYDHCALATIHRLAELRRTIFRAPSAKTE